MLSTYADEPRQYPVIDAPDVVSSRPNFNIAIYGGGFASFRDGKMREDITKRLNATTPPMFIAHAFDDAALNSSILFTALKQANVASELHIFAAGAHGFGVRESGLPVAAWRDNLTNWLRWLGYLDSRAARTYARAFAAAWSGGQSTLPRFSTQYPAATFADAWASQQRIVRAALAQGDAIAGYKGAYVSAAGQASLKIDGPMHGVLLKSGRLEAAAKPAIALDDKRPLLVETEIGYVIATDIGTQLRSPRQAVTSIEALVPVIELPVNVAPLMGGIADAMDGVAANIGSHRYIVGAPVGPESVNDLDALAVTLQRDGQQLHQGTGSEVKDGQAMNLLRLINQIIAQGHVLHRGDIIICGSLGGAKPGAKGKYVATYGPLGTIEFTLE
jgi:2-keto-4-pentenoate hydratase